MNLKEKTRKTSSKTSKSMTFCEIDEETTIGICGFNEILLGCHCY